MFIRSERLFLRPAWPEDAGDIGVLRADPVMSNIPALGTLPSDPALRDRSAVGGHRHYPAFLMTLPASAGSRIIGAIGLGREDDDVQLGYWISAAHWGRGYAAEAARAVLGLARTLGHRQVTANQVLDDRASLLVLTRAGFRPTGRQREVPTHDGSATLAAIYVADLVGDQCGGSGPRPGDRSERRAA